MSTPLLAAGEPAAQEYRGDLLIVVGSTGEPDYSRQFQEWTENWKAVATAGQIRIQQLGGDDATGTLPEIEQAIRPLHNNSQLPLWIVLIGHGTFDGRNSRFNLPGNDLAPATLNEWLAPISRPIGVICCFSASAPFLQTLAAPNRVVISATNSGSDVNFSRFGGYLAAALNDPSADLDKDGQTSLLEAFLLGSAQTQEFYSGDGRIPTEHPVLDDNGDGRPVPPEGFEGLQPVQRKDDPQRLPDGFIAHQWHLRASDADATLSPEAIAKRNTLELQIARLRVQKKDLSEAEYDTRLEVLLVEMAKLLILPQPKVDSASK
ncbi:hypothetical protein [Planctomicrobium sp. SH527]|uniref:hypothetical protein n=1 Tax=Planctomicrobium sp. SH527 TaxID=3448123 RepID=UPI003F5C128B